MHPNYFGRFSVSLTVRGARHLPLFTSLLGNSAKVVKAIIEAATTAKPEVKLRAWGLMAYGPPPFGIFNDSRDADSAESSDSA